MPTVPPEVPGDVQHRRGLVGARRRQPDISRVGQRDEQEGDADGLPQPRHGCIVQCHGRGQMRHVPQCERLDEQRAAHEHPRLNLVGEEACQRHGHEGGRAAERHGKARGGCRVTDHFLQHLWDELRGAEQDHAHDHDDEVRNGKIAVLEQLHIQQRRGSKPLQQHEADQCDRPR